MTLNIFRIMIKLAGYRQLPRLEALNLASKWLKRIKDQGE
jgi:hypothetical protein